MLLQPLRPRKLGDVKQKLFGDLISFLLSESQKDELKMEGKKKLNRLLSAAQTFGVCS